MLKSPRLMSKQELDAYSSRVGYTRSVATREVKLFVGWDYMQDLVAQVDPLLKDLEKKYFSWKKKYDEIVSKEKNIPGKKFIHLGRPPRKIVFDEESSIMHKGAIAAFFCTGARAGEILGIPDKAGGFVSAPFNPQSIRLDLNPDYVFIEGVKVIKRYRKISKKTVFRSDLPREAPSQLMHWEVDEERNQYKRTFWATVRVDDERTFQFRRDEPLVEHLLALAERRKGQASLLEPSSYGYWYWFFRHLDPMKSKYPSVRWKWIYPHWFRAERASQLRVDYGLDLHEIADWGKWRSIDVVRQYAGMPGSIEKKMHEANIGWKKEKG